VILVGLLFGATESPRWLSEHQLGTQNNREPLFAPKHRRALLIAVIIAIVSQLSGINAIMYYSTRIFSRAGIGIANAFWATMLVGFVNLVFTLVATAFIDRIGRRKLLLLGLAIQTVSLGIVGSSFLIPGGDLLLLVSILAFIAAFAMALGPISWLLPSEVFADAVRGRAMALVAFTVWVGAFVVAQTFPILNDSPSFGPALTFFLYAVISFAGLLFTLFNLPETRRLSLEEASDAVRRGVGTT
jgi:SP family arabinose:H+ symporter-like MFS transporter